MELLPTSFLMSLFQAGGRISAFLQHFLIPSSVAYFPLLLQMTCNIFIASSTIVVPPKSNHFYPDLCCFLLYPETSKPPSSSKRFGNWSSISVLQPTCREAIIPISADCLLLVIFDGRKRTKTIRSSSTENSSSLSLWADKLSRKITHGTPRPCCSS